MAGANPERTRELLTFDLQLRNAVAAGCSLEGVDEMPTLARLQEATRARILPASPMPRLVGFDEAGRGALAGPVAVACVAFNLPNSMRPGDGVAFNLPDSARPGDGVAVRLSKDMRPGDSVTFSLPNDVSLGDDDADDLCSALAHLDDSKRVTPKRREALFDSIRGAARCGIGYASAVEIDRRGIVAACRSAAARAVLQLGMPADLALFDRGLSLPANARPPWLREISLTRGDARSLHVAAASILAKISRDRLMERLSLRFPGYGFDKHKGYGTSAHRQAILERGVTPIHRRSFTRSLEVAKSQSC